MTLTLIRMISLRTSLRWTQSTKELFFLNQTFQALNESISTKEVVGEVVQVLATTLDTEDDEEGHLTTLNINAVMDIEPHGVGDAGFIQDEDIRGEVMDIVDGRAYHWKEWCLARGRNCLYIWSDAAALELSNRSNGWFRFILDDKLATMYSSGSPEGGRDSSENREEFLEKLQRARANVKPSAGSTELFKGGPSEATIVVGNWSLSCSSPTELNIVNSDGQQQSTKLKEDLPGFLFESHRGSKHYFTETSLGPEFSAGWTGKLHNGWIDDPWDLGGSNNYRLGAFGYEPESLTGAVSGNTLLNNKPDRPPQARPLTGWRAASTPSIPEATTGKSMDASFGPTVLADNLSSRAHPGGDSQVSDALTEGGGMENLAAESVAASVLSSVLAPDGHLGLESHNDNETLAPLLEVVDKIEAEDREMREKDSMRESTNMGNLNLRESLGLGRHAVTVNNETKSYYR